MFDSPALGLEARPLASGPATTPALDRLDADVARAADALRRWQKPDGHWVFELEADATIPAEYLLLRHYLGEEDDRELEAGIARYLRRIQSTEHGGWSLFHAGAFDISATVKAYFALKMAGDPADAPHMVRARQAVLAAGGAAAVNVFTKIQLALFGLKPPGVAAPWGDIPTMPPELILLPRWFPIHLSKMSYWARTVIVPLLVLGALKPVARNPRGIAVEELYAPAGTKPPAKATHAKPLWKAGFGALDVILKAVEGLWPKGLRARAICRCRAFVVERLNGEDGLGAIYPAMANSVMMFDALGYPPDHPDAATAWQSVQNLLVLDGDRAFCQPCLSPIWDTSLAGHAQAEAGEPDAVGRACTWLAARQATEQRGDWAWNRPDTPAGGWAFQYNNAHYPDVDDTAVVGMLLHRNGNPAHAAAVERARDWVLGMQSRNGGWGAFDADNDHDFLNHIPFADHGALLDPPTADVTARCVSFLAQLGHEANEPAMARALAYLRREQEPDGSWFGRWGTNYIYGTWSVLCALNAAGVPPGDDTVRRAVAWLLSKQRPDGGWGEDEESYAAAPPGEYKESTASQTAWALLGLMAAGEADDPAVARGMDYLQRTQGADGEWQEKAYTAVGFPRVFYLRYDGYRLFFPLLALARYRNLRHGNSRRVTFGF